MIHLAVSKTPGDNRWTACGRVVAGPSNYRVNIALVDCAECLDNTHACLSYEPTRIKAAVQ
jgi:hypothetical protein